MASAAITTHEASELGVAVPLAVTPARTTCFGSFVIHLPAQQKLVQHLLGTDSSWVLDREQRLIGITVPFCNHPANNPNSTNPERSCRGTQSLSCERPRPAGSMAHSFYYLERASPQDRRGPCSLLNKVGVPSNSFIYKEI